MCALSCPLSVIHIQWSIYPCRCNASLVERWMEEDSITGQTVVEGGTTTWREECSGINCCCWWWWWWSLWLSRLHAPHPLFDPPLHAPLTVPSPSSLLSRYTVLSSPSLSLLPFHRSHYTILSSSFSTPSHSNIPSFHSIFSFFCHSHLSHSSSL